MIAVIGLLLSFASFLTCDVEHVFERNVAGSIWSWGCGPVPNVIVFPNEGTWGSGSCIDLLIASKEGNSCSSYSENLPTGSMGSLIVRPHVLELGKQI